MKKFLIVVLTITLLYNLDTNAQRREFNNSGSNSFEGTKNAFYVELLGNGLIFSANYDVRLINKFGARLGVGYVGGTEAGVLTIPVMGNILLGKNGKYFEIGAGATFLSGTGDIFDLSEDSSTTWVHWVLCTEGNQKMVDLCGK